MAVKACRSVLIGVAVGLAAAAQQAFGQAAPRPLDEAEPTFDYPVGQYAVAFVFCALALWSVLRSSRRGW